jgi:hypothetical protein
LGNKLTLTDKQTVARQQRAEEVIDDWEGKEAEGEHDEQARHAYKANT